MRKIRNAARPAAICFLTAVIAAVLAAPASATPAAPGLPGWTVQPSPDPAGAVSAELNAVSCTGGSWCMAVGDYSKAVPYYRALAERWNGTAWALQAIPGVAGAYDDYLTGLSCPAPNLCIAVGSYRSAGHPSGRPLAEAWNGTRWAIQPTPSWGTGWGLLVSISCTAANSCIAVGGYSEPKVTPGEQPLAESWNGSHWAIVPTPRARSGSELDGLSCTAASACTAGGAYGYADIASAIFAMRWNGATWGEQSQLNPGSQRQVSESGVSCASESACTAVGYWTGFSGQEPLVEAWNGSTWAREHPVTPEGNHLAALNGVSCAGAAMCIAAGSWSPVSGGGTPTYTLAERWNGTGWAVQKTPSPTGYGSFNSVDCTSPAQCVAVGTTGKTLVEHYSG